MTATEGPEVVTPPYWTPRGGVGGYVLIDHPPMRIMGRFFIWAILNMPGGKAGRTEKGALTEMHGQMDVAPKSHTQLQAFPRITARSPKVEPENSLRTPRDLALPPSLLKTTRGKPGIL